MSILAVLPGGLYTWSFEREVGNWGVRLSDRVLRFLGVSAFFHAVFAYPEYLIWTNYVHLHILVHGRTAFRDTFIQGGRLPWWIFLTPIAYVVIPTTLGYVTAKGALKGWTWTRFLVGPDPAPRAWDKLFWGRPAFLVRLRLKNETWVGGLFGGASYASGYPEPQDLLLETTYEMEADGAFTQGESEGELVDLGSGILASWEDVHFP